MKKLTFSFILVIGFCFSFSEISAQEMLIPWAKVGGIPNNKEQVAASIQQKLPILYHELNQFPIDPVTEKTKMLETLLYKGMLSDIYAGKAVQAAYDDLIANFVLEYPEFSGEMYMKKREAINAFNSIVFLN